MSKLKTRIAEIQQLEDGTWLDTDTGEVTDMKPTEQKGVQWKEEVPRAQSKYPSNDYQNQWGKVSPFNIIMKDMIGQLYGLTPKMMADTVVALIESLNNEFGSMDETYDYVSQAYLKEFRYKLEQCRTSDKAIEYLTNVYFKGMGMGGGKSRKRASLDELTSIDLDLTDSEKLKRISTALNTYNAVMDGLTKFNSLETNLTEEQKNLLVSLSNSFDDLSREAEQNEDFNLFLAELDIFKMSLDDASSLIITKIK